MAAATMPPLVVQAMGGNVVTTVMVCACLNTVDASVLRRLHPAIAVAVAAVPWADTNTEVSDIRLWRAALPAAVGMRLSPAMPVPDALALAALSGVTTVELSRCPGVTDATIAHLPPTLRVLNVSGCWRLTQHASFAHLTALEVLDCSGTHAVTAGLARLPPSLRELHMNGCEVPHTADFSHLRNLRVVASTRLSSGTIASLPLSLEALDLSGTRNGTHTVAYGFWSSDWSAAHLTQLCEFKASCSNIDGAAIASLPPSLQVLDLQECTYLCYSLAISFAHLTCLHTLNLCDTPVSGATLATLPPSLVSLDLYRGSMLTAATVFPHLPALQKLNVGLTGIGDVAVASMPASLEELSMVSCNNVTQRARLDHLTALRELQSAGTDLLPAAIVACRARGCFAPVDGRLAVESGWKVTSLASLPDGRLAVGACGGRVELWEVAAGRSDNSLPVPVVAELELHDASVNALAVLPGGYRVAVGVSSADAGAAHDGIVVWDTRDAPHDVQVVTSVTIACTSGVLALAVARNDCLVAGCADGKLRVVDVDTRAIVLTLGKHVGPVKVVAVLLDGRVASAATDDKEVRVWNVDTGKRASTLFGHTDCITSLAVLADGRLATGSDDRTVRLWDAVSGVCIRVLAFHGTRVLALAVLPGNQLASVSVGGAIRVWDTRDEAAGAGGSLARPPRTILSGSLKPRALLASLPGNRLVVSSDSSMHLWQLPCHAP